MIKELPLTELPNIIVQERKREIEQKLYLMWLSHFTVAQLTGVEPKSFEEVLGGIKNTAPSGTSARTKEDIEAEAMRAVERYEKFAGKGGVT